MIYGVKCTSVSQCGTSVFFTLEDEAGRNIRIQQDAKLPINFEFGKHYVVEVAAVEVVEPARLVAEVIR